MNARDFKGHLLLLAEATNKDLSEPLVRLWQQKYGDLPDDLLLAAFARAVDTCRFFPAPAEFNDLLAGVRRAANGLADPEQRTATLLRKLTRYNPDTGLVNDGTRGLVVVGEGQPSGFDADELAVLDEHGGLYQCAMSPTRDAPFQRQKFVASFVRLATRRETADTLLALRPTGGLLGGGE